MYDKSPLMNAAAYNSGGCSAIKISPLENAIEELDMSAKALLDLTDKLEARLNPVLANHPIVNPEKKSEPQSTVPAVARLEDIKISLSRVADRHEVLLERLAL